MSKAAVLMRIRTDRGLRDEVQREAVLLAERWPEAPRGQQ
jgi:hypothetical protein